MRAARVLELVDQHVSIARLEAQPAFRELVEIVQQLDRALEHAGEVEERVRIERPLILAQRDREDAPHAARHHGVQIPAEPFDGVGHRLRNPCRRRAMTPPGVVGAAIGRFERRPGELVAARFAVLGKEVRPQTIDEISKCSLALAALKGPRHIIV